MLKILVLQAALFCLFIDSVSAATDRQRANQPPQNAAPVAAQKPDGDALKSDSSKEQTERKVSITQIPSRDVVDWIKFGGDILLVAVGIGTLLVIKRQASLMREHKISLEQLAEAAADNAKAAALSAETVGHQLGNMKEQVALMVSQTAMLERSVAAAEKSAKAANDNIELAISKERPRITVEIRGVFIDKGSVPRVEFALFCVGPTPAFVSSALASVEIKPSEIMQAGGMSIMSTRLSIPPIFRESELPMSAYAYSRIGSWGATDIADINQSCTWLHFRVEIAYRDVFGTDREFALGQVYGGVTPPMKNLDGTPFLRWTQGLAALNRET